MSRVPWHVVAAIAIFAVFIAAIAFFSAPPQSPAPAWLAARSLPVNTRLAPADLRQPEFPNPWSARGLPKKEDITGRYLRKEIASRQPIWPTDLAETPNITGTVLFFKTDSLGTAKSLVNAGSRVRVCPESGDCAPTQFPVEAVLGNDSATIALRVPDKDLDRLRKIEKPVLFVSSL